MKSRAFIVLAVSISFAAGLIVGESKRKPSLPTVESTQATDAAFRDGLYQAKLDVEEGRKPHPTIGRWSTPEARASFFAGYRRGYHPTSEVAWSGMGGISVAELAAAGYRDGMLDGSWHRIASQPFQAEETSNYRASGAIYLGPTMATEGYKHFYREGYMNGYQHAYFARPELQGEKSAQ